MSDQDKLIEALLQERDELYQELSRLRENDKGALGKAEKKNERYEAKIKVQDEEIKKLTDHLAWYRRKFWKSSSERFIPQDPNQRKIDFEGLDVLPQEKEIIEKAEKEITSYQRTKPQVKSKPIRQPLPEHLRRESEVIEPEGIDENWIRIGQEITEVLEHKPGELYVRQIIRPKYALKKETQDQANVKIAKLPMLPLPRSNAGASLLADLILSKYLYHIPFHRKIDMYKQAGVHIPASTINGWFSQSGDLLKALYYRLRELVLETDYIQVDESTIPVINNKKKRAVKAYIWVVRSVMKNLVFFHYDKGSRAQKVVVELLHNYTGAVQTDGYEAYSIYENKKDVLLLGCWAHSRRKFTESIKEDKEGAEYALKQIGMLYKVEDMAKDKDLDAEQRAELRQRLAYPILCAFEKWIVNYYPKTIPGGRMNKALSYTYNQFHKLSRYHLDGRYQLDNNLVENEIRALAIGRKNFMFCGNHDAAENAAIMYSLFGCCKASDVNPKEWFTDVLTRIPQYNNDYSMDLADLLPHNWKVSNSVQ
ncbi:MAG: IS66 family transposase [Bacteroidetes bacterium]|jgi:transposase|nr:IS66 family transposase [Bacteroidota bacterium]MBT4410176.1 IS66 family transposase [Bacteroidota bacterium]MBT7092601.1 IS66 family transposase [Bacteroidota bacterium]